MDGITGGYTLFGKTIKTGDFENEKAEVRLDFSDPELLDKAGELAKNKVFELLGVKKAKAKVADEPAVAGSDVETKDGRITKGNKGKPVVPAKSVDVISDPAAVADPLAQAATISLAEVTPPAPAVPASSVVASAAAASTASTASTAAVVEPPASSEAWEAVAEPVAEIKDTDLNAALARKNSEIKNPVAIKALIGKFAGVGKFASQITKDKRADFLAELAKLTAAKI